MPSYDIRGVPVEFPFSAYDCQLVYMEKVIQSLQESKNALLESPTGTGKTLCLVCSTLAWRKKHVRDEIERVSLQFENGELEFTQEEMSFSSSATPSQLIHRKVMREAPKIIYASRTHSQLSQVMDELKNCPYNPKASVLGSRKQLCINPSVTNKPSTTQGNHCRKLVSQHKCRYAHKVQDFKNHHDFVDEPLAIEELAKLGRQHNVCPYYISKEMQTDAEIILLPYNYLIDPTSRKSLNIDLKGSVLIFDEAHNLESVCTDAASFQIYSSSISKCSDQLATVSQLAGNSSAFLESYEITKETINKLKEIFRKLFDAVMKLEISASGKGIIKPGEFIFELFQTAGVNTENVQFVREALDVVSSIISDELGTGSTFNVEQFSTALSLVFNECVPATISKYYKVYIDEYTPQRQIYGRPSEKSRTLNFWCFNSGVAMKALNTSGIRSFILTSGTLSPLDSFAYELQTEFPIQLENPHVINEKQIWVGVASCGPSGHPLNTSYQTRSSERYIQELGNTIVNFCRIVPSGLLVFFSSYTIMEQYIESWKRGLGDNTAIWDRITLYKKPISEPRDGSILNDTIEDFYKKVRDPDEKGAVFFAVCRGKVSEGLDFANDNGRAVVVTGIPFPNMGDQRVKLKQQYLDLNAKTVTKVKTLTGNEWYKQQASRAVNQAVGRVIRHRNDYGAIILCDERFGHAQNRNQLSSWLRPHTKVHRKFGEVSLGLTRFFKYASANFTVQSKEMTRSVAAESSVEVKITRPIVKRKKFNAPRPIGANAPAIGRSLVGVKRKREAVTSSGSLTASYNQLTNKLNGGVSTQTSTTSAEARKKKKAKTAVEFIGQAKRTLTPAEYKNFQAYLRQYKQKTLPIEELVESVKELFASDEKKHLLKGFALFIPEKYRATYAIMLESIFSSSISGPVTKESSSVSMNENSKSAVAPATVVEPTWREKARLVKKEVKQKDQQVIEIRDDPPSSPIIECSAASSENLLSKPPMVNIPIPPKSPKIFSQSTSQLPSEVEKIKSNKTTHKGSSYDLLTGKPIKVPKRVKPSSSNETKSEPMFKAKTNELEISETAETEETAVNESENLSSDLDVHTAAVDRVGIQCSACHDTAVAPFSSRCGHICCKSCWDRWLGEQLSCPVCRLRVRQKQLTKLYFT